MKHDGFRVLARKQGERVQVWSRRGADFTYRFPAIGEAIRALPVDRALIDGEAAVLRIDGRSAFGALMTKRGAAQATLVAFDLLRLNGESVLRLLGRDELLAPESMRKFGSLFKTTRKAIALQKRY